MPHIILILALMFLVTGCSTPDKRHPPLEEVRVMPAPEPEEPQCDYHSKGLASWYGHELAGNKTASGEKFNPDGISVAHRTLPFGTLLHVTLDDLSRGGNPEGVYVRVNDRGPFKRGRIV
ncbi:MAG TPA: septal ring lytic transglycosylase RlpA family protein, partial [Alphaproteobacteria bacterium]|nr:septal ring lytic transglycosylase RlpA family protein [Alphaproteobacteria bacterium]